jgi:hypothetical protein
MGKERKLIIHAVLRAADPKGAKATVSAAHQPPLYPAEDGMPSQDGIR